VDVQTRVKTKSYLCVPLKTRERSLGVLTAVNKCQGFFSADDVRLAEAFASQLAVALDNARLTEKLAMVQGQRRGRSPFVQKEHQSGTGLSALIGQGARMQEVYWLSEQILHTTTTVLLTGESGTGKDLMARIIHAHGARAKGPFIAVNCAAIPEALLEAELFGYERGAFTNATQRKPGRFELAAGGTLFLDEIGEMSPALQAKLLRVLQEKQFERLGSTKTTRTDVRTIAATNRNLPQLIAEGKFREDLFYRLNVYPIPLPPLRERREDILPLAEHFLQRFTKGLGKDGVVLSKDVRERLMRHTWPGNVRELENVIERAAILCRGTEVTLQELPSSLQEQGEEHNPRVGHGRMPVGVTLAELEKQCIVQALERVNYNQLRASRLLGLSRTQLRTRMRNYGLEKKAMTITYAAQPLEQAFGREERREFLLQ
jgi:Nif-specific regulatory protein